MRLLMIAAAAAIAGLAVAVAIRLYMGRAAQDRLGAGEDVAITALRPPLPGNGFLVCPAGYCAVADAAAAPVFNMPLPELEQCWRRMLAAEPRLVEAASDPARHRAVYIQHTPLLRFPDIVTVEFIAVDGERASLAIYSRARYGRLDFGTNRRRVEAWLTQLSAAGRRQSG